MRAGEISARLILTVLGGYVLTAALVSASVIALPWIGLAASESVLLASMLGFVFYLVLILWGFHEHSLLRVALMICIPAIVSLVFVVAFAPHVGQG